MEEITILDGGTGHILNESAIQKYKNIGEVFTHPFWSSGLLENDEELVEQVHETFAKNGSEILFSNTYSIHFKNNNSDDINLINKLFLKNIEILLKICSKYSIRFFISIGPIAVRFHDCSEYTGIYLKDGRVKKEDIIYHYDSLLQQIIKYDHKYIVFETIPSLIEIHVITELLSKYPSIKCFITVVPIDEDHIAYGDKIIDAALLASKSDQVLAFGINCCNPRLCLSICKNLSSIIPNQTLIIKPNDGRIYDVINKKYIGEYYDLCQVFKELIRYNVKYIGGCCTVTPKTIQKYRSIKNNYNKS